MTATLSLIDDTYSSNPGSYKRLMCSISCTNPYTAGGEVIDVSSYFKTRMIGAHQVGVNPSVTAALAGLGHTAQFIGDTSSTSTFRLKLWNTGLTGTASAGLFVDNTTANISGLTIYAEIIGY